VAQRRAIDGSWCAEAQPRRKAQFVTLAAGRCTWGMSRVPVSIPCEDPGARRGGWRTLRPPAATSDTRVTPKPGKQREHPGPRALSLVARSPLAVARHQSVGCGWTPPPGPSPAAVAHSRRPPTATAGVCRRATRHGSAPARGADNRGPGLRSGAAGTCLRCSASVGRRAPRSSLRGPR